MEVVKLAMRGFSIEYTPRSQSSCYKIWNNRASQVLVSFLEIALVLSF